MDRWNELQTLSSFFLGQGDVVIFSKMLSRVSAGSANDTVGKSAFFYFSVVFQVSSA